MALNEAKGMVYPYARFLAARHFAVADKTARSSAREPTGNDQLATFKGRPGEIGAQIDGRKGGSAGAIVHALVAGRMLLT